MSDIIRKEIAFHKDMNRHLSEQVMIIRGIMKEVARIHGKRAIMADVERALGGLELLASKSHTTVYHYTRRLNEEKKL